MNVMVVNKFKDLLNNLNIDIMKKVEGVFNVDEIIDTFSNLYYDKMILDITAIRDYHNIDNIQKLAMNLKVDNIVLLLDNDPICNSNDFISHLVNIGLYNFTKDVSNINYLLVNPHNYRDVVNLNNVAEINEKSQTFVNTTPINTAPTYNVNMSGGNKLKIIGVKNLTTHAGATSLIYMMKKCLETSRKVCAFEVNKMDFLYYKDPEMMSTTSSSLLKEIMRRQEYDIIFVDINDYDDVEFCTNVLYLIEPSVLKFNKLLAMDKNVLKECRDRTIILNQCEIPTEDVYTFEYETRLKTFFTIPSLNDREKDIQIIRSLTDKLGL